MFFYIVLCSSVLDYDLLHCVMRNQIMLTVAIAQFCSLPCFMAFLSDRIVLCFSVLSYGKVIYAHVISCVALSVQNLDDWARAGNGSNVSKWRTRMTKILRLSIKGLSYCERRQNYSPLLQAIITGLQQLRVQITGQRE